MAYQLSCLKNMYATQATSEQLYDSGRCRAILANCSTTHRISCVPSQQIWRWDLFSVAYGLAAASFILAYLYT